MLIDVVKSGNMEANLVIVTILRNCEFSDYGCYSANLSKDRDAKP